jgi:uncharacterized protein (DUF362 family)
MMREKRMKKKMNRREFMVKGTSAALGAGLASKTGLGFRSNTELPSRVIEVTHPGSVADGRRVDKTAVRTMIRQGMKALTGNDQPWTQFLSLNDRVGLKINTLGRPLLFTHHELIQAMVEELKDYGIKENNIIVWDRWEHHMIACKFTLNVSDQGVRCYGTESRDPSVRRLDPDVVYRSDFDTPDEREEGIDSLYSSIFTQDCDKVINLAIIKDHSNSGVTMCLKNLAYGLCNNNNRFHKPPYIGPFIADFCSQPLVRKKVVLHLIDGLEGCYEGGPVPDSSRFFFTPKTLWLGTDPVALDAVGFQVIESKRLKKGLPSLRESAGYYSGRRPVDHIDLAAKKGVGTSDPDRIKVEKISL